MRSAALYKRRRARNAMVVALSMAATAIGIMWLALILYALLSNGLAALEPSLFAEMTPPPGSKGGLLNPIAGSLLMTIFGTLVGTPVGILAGTFLAEYGRGSRLASVVRFINDILLSAPSIIVGLFVYRARGAAHGPFLGLGGRR